MTRYTFGSCSGWLARYTGMLSTGSCRGWLGSLGRAMRPSASLSRCSSALGPLPALMLYAATHFPSGFAKQVMLRMRGLWFAGL